MLKYVLFAASLVLLAAKYEAHQIEQKSILRIKHGNIKKNTGTSSDSDSDIEEDQSRSKPKSKYVTVLNYKQQQQISGKHNFAQTDKNQDNKIYNLIIKALQRNTSDELDSLEDKSKNTNEDSSNDSTDESNTEKDTDSDIDDENSDSNEVDTNEDTDSDKGQVWNKKKIIHTIYYRKSEKDDSNEKDDKRNGGKNRRKKHNGKKPKPDDDDDDDNGSDNDASDAKSKEIVCTCTENKDINNLFCASNWESYYSNCMMECESKKTKTKLTKMYDGICRPYYD